MIPAFPGNLLGNYQEFKYQKTLGLSIFFPGQSKYLQIDSFPVNCQQSNLHIKQLLSNIIINL